MGQRCCCISNSDTEQSLCVVEGSGGPTTFSNRHLCQEKCYWDLEPHYIQTKEVDIYPKHDTEPLSMRSMATGSWRSPSAKEMKSPPNKTLEEVQMLVMTLRWREAAKLASEMPEGSLPPALLDSIALHNSVLSGCHTDIRWNWWNRPPPDVMGKSEEWPESDALCFHSRLDRYCVVRGQVWVEPPDRLQINVQLESIPVPVHLLLVALAEVDLWSEFMDAMGHYHMFADVLRTYGPRDRLVALSFQLPLNAVPRVEILMNRVEIDCLDPFQSLQQDESPAADGGAESGTFREATGSSAWPPGFLAAEQDPSAATGGIGGGSWRGGPLPPNAGTTRCSRKLTIFAEIVKTGVTLHIGGQLTLPLSLWNLPLREIVGLIREACTTTYHLLMHVAWQNDHPLTHTLQSRIASDAAFYDVVRHRVALRRSREGWPEDVPRPTLPPMPTGRCEREGCKYAKHPYFFNNGGRYCCRRCSRTGKHGNTCQKRLWVPGEDGGRRWGPRKETPDYPSGIPSNMV
eukprot:CAMPEP_0178396200 /NCGR_PEP_ID=MMETSP0689_2-20121128/13609_1 /TAXON_ID=160604 /ORGANISM="Amphidinium massartii, Strain CS-259" /LENGTH=515 /DNA_ID=CAMNT_0020016873 /DNA_START=23 /DNA_END=1566 /DNA_ORIENTATION=+